MAAKTKTIKRLVVNFYDNDRDRLCVQWLEGQHIMAESLKNLIAEKVAKEENKEHGLQK